MRDGRRLLLALLGGAVIVLSFPAVASAHYERPTTAPDGTGHVPAYRTGGQHLLVCKNDPTDFEKRVAGFSQELQDYNRGLYAACTQNGYPDLQAAVDHVTGDGMTILVLPGLYLEEPSLLPESDACNHLPAKRVPAGYQILSYEQQKMCPHEQNLVGIFGIKGLQIEGTGATPADVVFDAQFQKLNVIRGDRTNGLYMRNFTTQRSTFNAIYVIETDGFVINHVVGRWNTEYGFLSFAADHALFEHNLIHSNNTNYYPYVRDGTCSRPYLRRGIEKGVVCPGPGVPVGVGILVIGGNYNLFRDNWIYDNWKIGVAQTWVPGAVRND